ncbi:DUF4236 domain-containing protein [Yersinia pestis]|uniref:DUF4236 domain-containing protein n=2 Tax=Yersinia pestis TaxID=632 RepID=UPI00035EC1F8|nr:DUF4236 domain-containing protein [Yersinia pestis]MBE7853440.1 DUF4236 domain-containing protein [Yersinia pestis]
MVFFFGVDMAFRFRQRVKIAPGVYVNIGKKGISTSVGIKGATVNFGKNGTRGTIGLPGTGMSYSEKLFSNRPQSEKSTDTDSFESAQQDESFDNFVETVQNECILMFYSYLKANNIDIDNFDTSIDSSELVSDKEKDKELEKLMSKLASTIEEIRFSGASGQREKNRISKDLFVIKNWLNENFPCWEQAKKEIIDNANKLEEKEQEIKLQEQLLREEKEKKERINRIIGKIGFVVLIPCVIFIPPIFYWFSLFNKHVPKWFKIAGGIWLLITCSIYYFSQK